MHVGGCAVVGVILGMRLIPDHQVVDCGVIILDVIQGGGHLAAITHHQSRTALGGAVQGCFGGIQAGIRRSKLLRGIIKIAAKRLHAVPYSRTGTDIRSLGTNCQRDCGSGAVQRLVHFFCRKFIQGIARQHLFLILCSRFRGSAAAAARQRQPKGQCQHQAKQPPGCKTFVLG